MNDLVSEYQQYQDATAEGLSEYWIICIFFVEFFQKKEKVARVKKKNNTLK